MDCTFLLEVFLGTNLYIPLQPCRTHFHICGPFSVLPSRLTESGSSTNRAIAGRFFLLQSCEQLAAYMPDLEVVQMVGDHLSWLPWDVTSSRVHFPSQV